MSDLKFTADHEWLSIDGDIVTIGITNFAQEQLGDVVFVELPEEGQEVNPGDELAVIESVKAAGEINSPVEGVVIEVNEALVETPELVNQDPMGDAWFFRIRISEELDESELMTEAEYLDTLED